MWLLTSPDSVHDTFLLHGRGFRLRRRCIDLPEDSYYRSEILVRNGQQFRVLVFFYNLTYYTSGQVVDVDSMLRLAYRGFFNLGGVLQYVFHTIFAFVCYVHLSCSVPVQWIVYQD
ncbi:unnamed protein product [Choristocarpus tenellus]